MIALQVPVFVLSTEWRPMVALGLVAWVVLLGTIPRSRTAVALTVAAVFTHLVTYAPRTQLHDLSAFQEILASNGMLAPDTLYGEGRVALVQWPLALLGFPMDGTHWVHSALSVLAVPHLYAVMRRLFDERAGVVAALLLAIAPLPLAIAPTETPFVALATMQVLAIHGLSRTGWVADLMVVLGAGFVTHLRPLEGLFGAAICAVAWSLGRRRAAAGVAAMVAWRLVTWGGAPPPNHGYPLDQWNYVDVQLRQLFGPEGRLVIFNPLRSPAVLVVLAPLGVWAGWRRSRWATAGLTSLVVVSTLVYINQGAPSDTLRYQSPVQVWWCALAALGLMAVARRPVVLALVLLVGAPSWWMARHPYPPFPWQIEYTLLRRALATLPPGTVVAYDDAVDQRRYEARWVELYAGVKLVPESAAPADVAWRWVGLADHVHGVKPPPPGAAVVEETIVSPDRLWGCEVCDGAPMTIGLYPRAASP